MHYPSYALAWAPIYRPRRIDMDLRDPHLEKVLQHAPDRDMVPGEIVRKKVLEHAKQASRKPHGYWLAGLLSGMRNWQWAGMGSVAVALLVLLMVHEQRPADSEWAPPTAPEQAARADAPKRKAAVAKPAAEEMAPEEMAAPAEVPATPEAFADAATAPKAEAEQAAPVMADALSQEGAAPLPKEDANAEADALAEPRAKSTLEASAEDVAGESEDADANLQYALMTQGGKALAEQDIRAGNHRLLKIETPQGGRCDEPSAHVSRADTETGYPIEIVNVCVVPVALIDETEAYNQAMRAWYKQRVNQ